MECTSLRLLILLWGLAALATSGCADDTADDDTIQPPADDDTAGDDDGADDDSGDDDTAEGPCSYSELWYDAPAGEDAQGDSAGYLLDIRSLQYQYADPYLYFRLRGWEPFDVHDDDLTAHVLVKLGDSEHALVWDNRKPNPGPLQYWNQENQWEEPQELPESMHVCADEEDSFVIGIDPLPLLPPSWQG